MAKSSGEINYSTLEIILLVGELVRPIKPEMIPRLNIDDSAALYSTKGAKDALEA